MHGARGPSARADAPAVVNRRILIVDDNRAIHEDFRKIPRDKKGSWR